MSIIQILLSGLYALGEYLSAHVLTCLVPAFFIAGAISVFLSKDAVLKYLGPQAKKVVSYGVASVSGSILAVCSCTVLPLFAGILRRGAGLGPATTFLYSGPAVNILAIVYTAAVLGYDLGVARAIGAISMSIVIGFIMATIFQEEKRANIMTTTVNEEGESNLFPKLSVFSLLILILVVGASKIALLTKSISLLAFIVLLIFCLLKWFTIEDVKEWLEETWGFFKMIFPLLLVGVFIAGILQALLPQKIVEAYLGGEGILPNFLASVIGALMYFATLTEVPIIKTLMNLGMGNGPALTLLLAGPSLSLPNMIVIGRIMGIKKTIIYITLVVIISALVGYAYGNIF
ncbi:MAG: permease [Methanothermobacter sp.]|nr:permease [Methanothermobacter sp.]